jgi:hypothetical protein
MGYENRFSIHLHTSVRRKNIYTVPTEKIAEEKIMIALEHADIDSSVCEFYQFIDYGLEIGIHVSLFAKPEIEKIAHDEQAVYTITLYRIEKSQQACVSIA